jgi:hypothetical protein
MTAAHVEDCALCATAAAIWNSAAPDRPWTAMDAASAEVDADDDLWMDRGEEQALERRARDWIERTYR